MTKPKKTTIERRLEAGVTLRREHDNERHKHTWTFSDTGRGAHLGTCNRLLTAGKIVSLGDGLFPDDAQTYGLAT